jgi:hypothetical protein
MLGDAATIQHARQCSSSNPQAPENKSTKLSPVQLLSLAVQQRFGLALPEKVCIAFTVLRRDHWQQQVRKVDTREACYWACFGVANVTTHMLAGFHAGSSQQLRPAVEASSCAMQYHPRQQCN